MSFSTALSLQDVDDFIAPAQTCVKPVKIDKQLGKTKSVRIEEDGSYTALTEDGESYKLTKASITLNDCLACSGCITTAESVLISQHSCESLIQFLVQNREKDIDLRQVVVVSISPQSLASVTSALINQSDILFERRFRAWMSERNSSSTSDVHLKIVRTFLTDYLNSLGVHLVLDTSWARDIVLKESAMEFLKHFNCAQSKDHFECNFPLPLFCGICPGWVCYAEKTHGGTGASSQFVDAEPFSLIPYLSRIRSPQQTIGRLVKRNGPQSVFHITIMPCFDKKLEASRQEFSTLNGSDNDKPIPDVDFVLATNELMQLIGEHQIENICTASPPVLSFSNQNRLSELKQLFDHLLNNGEANSFANLDVPALYRHAGSGSGGYAAFIFAHTARHLFNIDLTSCLTNDPRVLIRELQNRDLQEMLLFRSGQECDDAKQALNQLSTRRTPFRQCKVPQSALLAFAVANGFRNIQNVVHKLKLSSLRSSSDVTNTRTPSTKSRSVVFPFDYVEIMACPGGCLNGGGQVKGSLEGTKTLYNQLIVHEPLSMDATKRLYDYLTESDPEHKNLRTTFRQVPKIEIITPSALRW